MEAGTSSTAVMGPKTKSQNPAARAKRLKRLRANPDFAEAVADELALRPPKKTMVITWPSI
jgi:hypothetical protein